MRLKKRSARRAIMVRPLKPWLLAAGVLVSFTATAGIRTTVDMSTPGLRFDADPVNISLAWPTLTAPDIALATEDFLRPPAPSAMGDVAVDLDDEAQLQPGLWRGAQVTDGTEAPTEATPEISILFRLGGEMMPAAQPFSQDDGGIVVGSFSGLVPLATAETTPSLPAKPDTIVVAKIAPVVVAPAAPVTIQRVALPQPSRPVPPRSPLVGTVTSEREMRCLAEAVYFEARSEPERGQAGVAQVVLNRARSGVYPSTVCGVVYQNRHRYLACQFTFACEGKALRTNEPGAWATAQRIARDVAEGRTYLPGVGNATHYHANYVRPWWARHMDRREKVGKHIFYFESAEN
jgi:hypothetical protein